MKKTISKIIILSHLFIYCKANAFDFDYEQFMRAAGNAVDTEKKVLIPSAVYTMYSSSIYAKYKHTSNVVKNFNESLMYLQFSNDEFNKLYKTINIDLINDIESYKNLLKTINILEKYIDNSRNALYTYRESEINLLNIKNILNGYCASSSSLVNAKSLTLIPLPYNAPDLKPDFSDLEDKFKNEYAKNIYITSSIIGRSISFINPFLGVAAGAVALGIGSVISSLLFGHKKRKREREIEDIKKKIQYKYKEAEKWYIENTTLNKPEEINKIAFDICTSSEKNIEIKDSEQKIISIVSVKSEIERLNYMLSQAQISANLTNGNNQYTTEQLIKLRNLFAFKRGNVIDPDWKDYKDNLSLNFQKMVQSVDALNTELTNSRNKIAKIFSNADIKKIQKINKSSANLEEAAKIIFQDIGTDLGNELFLNYIENRESCKIFVEINEKILNNINILKEIILEEYVDDYNKDSLLFTDRLPNLINILNKVSKSRTNKICKG